MQLIETNFRMPKGFDHAFLLFGRDDRWLGVIETEPPNHIRLQCRPDIEGSELADSLDWSQWTVEWIRQHCKK